MRNLFMLFSFLFLFGGTKLMPAQSQDLVDIGLFQVACDTLEVRARAQQDFDGIVSNIVFTIRWSAASGATLGNRIQGFPEIAYIPMTKSGAEQDDNGFRYQIFAGFGSLPMSTFGEIWQAGVEVPLFKVPINNASDPFEIVNDAWTNDINNNGDYFVSLGGVNKTGTIFTPAVQCGNTCESPVNVRTTNVSSNSVRLRWDCDTSAAAYLIRGNALGTSGFIELAVNGPCSGNLPVNNLPSSTSFFWQIKAICNVNDSIESDWSVADTFTTLCSNPEPLATLSIQSTSATLDWERVQGAAGYQLQGRIQGGSNWITLDRGAGGSEFNATQLEPNTTYEWRVRTLCDAASGVYSAFSSISTFTTVVCIAPSPISSSNITDVSATLTWTAVPNAQGYLLQGKQVTFGNWIDFQFPSTTTQINTNSLAANKTYVWRVRAYCDANQQANSPFSEIDTFTTTNGSAKMANLESEQSFDVEIYPNPSTNGWFSLHFDALEVESELNVYNSLGQLVLTRLINTESALAGQDFYLAQSGSYYLQIKAKTAEPGSINTTKLLIVQ